jgi:hypothetical protein
MAWNFGMDRPVLLWPAQKASRVIINNGSLTSPMISALSVYVAMIISMSRCTLPTSTPAVP